MLKVKERCVGLLIIILALIVLLAAYTVWPIYDLYRIASAVETRNSTALQELVDFPSLRASLAKQIVDAYPKLTGKSAGLSERSGSLVTGFGLAKILNPERLLDLLGKGSADFEQFRQRMADLAQLGLQRQNLLCSRSC